MAQSIPAGTFTVGERRLLWSIVEAIDGVLQHDRGFASLMNDLSLTMRELRQHGLDVDEAFAGIGAKNLLNNTHRDDEQSLSEMQKAFLVDMKGLIDFVLRNRLNPNRVWIAVSHDVAEIERNSFNIEGAVDAECFRPVVTGWGKKNLEVVGDGED